MADNASVRSARTKRSSERSSRVGSLAGSQAGSAAQMVPISKTNRFDEVTKKPIPNLFNAEVMRALGTRGGALWERLVKEDHMRSADAGHVGGSVDWAEAVKRTGVASSDDIEFYNRRFGLEKDCKVKITKTLLNKITECIQKHDDGDRLITKKEFLQAVVGAGLSHLTSAQYTKIFTSIDKDGSGQIDFDEWMEAIDPVYNKKFGLEGAKVGSGVDEKKIMITKTLLNTITNALLWEELEKEEEGKEVKYMGITSKGFVQSCQNAALSQLTEDQYTTMFKAVDTDGSGIITKDEWLKALEMPDN